MNCAGTNPLPAASAEQDTTLDEVLRRLGQPQYWHGRRVRALSPFAPDDRQLLQAISRGEFTINGIRNRDFIFEGQQLALKPGIQLPAQQTASAAAVAVLNSSVVFMPTA